MNLCVDVQNASSVKALPSQEHFEQWVAAALDGRRDEAELSIRLVDDSESAQLNQQYRHKSGPTNVLSFPADIPPELNIPLLGDLVVCAPLVLREACEQGKSEEAHWAHLIIHGTLHLLGYDHIEDTEADIMEALEIEVLAGLHYPNPYSLLNAVTGGKHPNS